MVYPRYLTERIREDLTEKMVFIGGPRQVGKTTLALSIAHERYPRNQYLNWDSAPDRKNIINCTFDPDATLLIFDELHKYRLWKRHVKGIYDTSQRRFDILVTGSARLDLYRRGGDSLHGRYHYHRLHPFSLREALALAPATIVPLEQLPFSSSLPAGSEKMLSRLMTYGGFPEPFLAQNPRTHARWSATRLDRIIKEDIRDIETIRDLSLLQVLVEILPSKVGSLLSLNSLREDLGVAHKTIATWVEVLERFYYHVRVPAYTASTIRSVRKLPKLYMWDWSQVEGHSARLENLVAMHLLKFVHYLHDSEGCAAELFFLRDTQEREVDFVVTVKKKPWFAVEVKESDEQPSSSLEYFGKMLKIPFLYQVVNQRNVDRLHRFVRMISIEKFLTGLV